MPICHITLLIFFIWGFSFHLRIFHTFGDVTITGLRGPVTLTPIAKCLAVELSLSDFTT